MNSVLRILIVEDSPADAELMLREIKRAGFNPQWQRVDTEPGFIAALAADPDIILSDFCMPEFDGVRAMLILRERGLDIPLILVSGTLGEESAVTAMKSGATDYILKDRLARLGLAVEKALAEKRQRKERRKTEDALRAAETRLALATEAANIGAWDWDLVNNQVFFAPEWKRQIGYADDELSNSFQEWESRLHLEDRARVLAAVATYLGNPDVGYDVEFRLRHKDGSYRWIQTRGMIISDSEHKPVRMVGCHIDITERRHGDQALREAEERYRSIFENAIEGMFQSTREGKYLAVNPSMARMFGFESPEVMVREVTNIAEQIYVDPARREEFKRIVAEKGEVVNFETEARSKGGGKLWVSQSGRATRGPDGQILCFAGSVEDITKSKLLEQQVRHLQKMEAIGQLAGGVAHDFNNVLAVMIMHTELAIADVGTPEQVIDSLKEIRVAADRGANLTRQLLAFSSRQTLRAEPLDLNTAVGSISKMLRRLLGDNVRLELHLMPKPLVAVADAGMIDQVVLNLVVNARDAMPCGGGLVTVETGDTVVDKAEAALNADARPGPYIWIRVSDNGCGIARKNIHRIFEPFFTTKEVGKGTGLGLATVFGIIKQHQGWIRVISEEGVGSIFEVFLPPAVASSQVMADGAKPLVRGGTETILLAEDDDALRALLRVTLERHGYQVEEACDGAAALAVWDSVKPKVHLLCTDMVMPGGMLGNQLAARLVADKPSLKVVFCSGYSSTLPGREWSLLPGQQFLHKPFPPDRLLKAVRDTLDFQPPEAAVTPP